MEHMAHGIEEVLRSFRAELHMNVLSSDSLAFNGCFLLARRVGITYSILENTAIPMKQANSNLGVRDELEYQQEL